MKEFDFSVYYLNIVVSYLKHKKKYDKRYKNCGILLSYKISTKVFGIIF